MASILKVNEIQHTGGTSALTVDSGGRVTQSSRPVWRVFNVGAQSTTDWTATDYYPIVYSHTVIDTASGWTSGSSNLYTIPVTGNYVFHINQRCDGPAAGQWFQLYLDVNGEDRFRWIVDLNDGGGANIGYYTFSVSDMAPFTAGDTLQVRFGANADSAITLQGASSAASDSTNQYSNFSGYFLG